MGGSVSCPLPRYGCCVPRHSYNNCKENHTSTPKIKSHRRNLSAAFNIAELTTEYNVEQLNLNTATEEEMMTLPGINRQTARNIVEYRGQIGCFKKVEDLALVSGVGATRLNQIRLEICVVRKKSSQNSSTTSSRVDLSFPDNVSGSSRQSHLSRLVSLPKVNANTSNVFQLMRVKGLTQTLAENIVAYRDKKGPFRRVDDLLKVRGIKSALLSAIRPYILLEDEPRTDTSHLNGTLPNSSHTHLASVEHNRISGLRQSQEDMISLYGPVARASTRRNKRQCLFRKQLRPIFRIATWNLQKCSSQKIHNPGVKEVAAMTILENGLSIVAVQELVDKDALQKLCDELNQPTIPNVKRWAGHRGTWSSVTSQEIGQLYEGMEYLGFMYDTSRGIELENSWLLDGTTHNNSHTTRYPFVGVFKVKARRLVLVNTHLHLAKCNDSKLSEATDQLPDNGSKHSEATDQLPDKDTKPTEATDQLAQFTQAIHQHLPEEQNIIILGDFNTDTAAEGVEQKDYKNALPDDTFTNITTDNLEGSLSLDNIWFTPTILNMHTGECQVIREGLSSPWIPDGWSWGGLISDHCPVWAEFYMDKPDTSNTVNNYDLHG